MKKTLLLFSFVFAATWSQAAYMYWQVDNSAETKAKINQYAIDNNYAYARLRTFETDGGSVDFVNNAVVDGLNGTIAGTGEAASIDNAIQVELLQGNSYYIELLAWNGSTFTGVGRSEVKSYADLVSDGYVYTNADLANMPTLNLQSWAGGTYSVPEPTSALMMMMGMAFLGLKRRKA